MGSAERAQWLFPANEAGKVLGWEPTVGKHLVNVNLPTFDVKQFGAEGDGVTDDTAAITAALARLTSGGVLFFPAGTYLISSTIDTLSNVTFAGAGMGASIILADAADFNMIEVQDGQSDIAFRELHIKGGAASDATTQYGIYASASTTSRITISDCRFSNTNNGISAGVASYWKITGNHFDTLIGAIASTGYGVLIAGSGAKHNLVSGNSFLGSSGNGRHAVYLSVGCTWTHVIGNTIEEFNESAIVCRATSGQAGVVGNRISNNVIKGGGTTGTAEAAGIKLGGVASHNVIADNDISDFDNTGILITDDGQGGACDMNVVQGNFVTSAAFMGIDIMGTKNTRVRNNTVSGSSRNSSGVYPGIRVTSTGSFGTEVCTNTVLLGNTSRGSTQRNAFQINNGAPVATGTVVGANDFKAGATAGRAIELNSATLTYIGNFTDNIETYGTDDATNEWSRDDSLNYSSISGGATSEQTVTFTGLPFSFTAVGWEVTAVPEGGLEADLVIAMVAITGTNTVTIRLYNPTGSPIDPAARVWRTTVRKRN